MVFRQAGVRRIYGVQTICCQMAGRYFTSSSVNTGLTVRVMLEIALVMPLVRSSNSRRVEQMPTESLRALDMPEISLMDIHFVTPLKCGGRSFLPASHSHLRGQTVPSSQRDAPCPVVTPSLERAWLGVACKPETSGFIVPHSTNANKPQKGGDAT